jgi:threonyl-tRNA synthetase
LAEFGLVHRHELSGVLHGLFRVRSFTIDDGHIFCTPDQLESEALADIQLIHKVMNHFGFENIEIKLATRPDNSMGSDELWQQATNALKNALAKADKQYTIAEGDGAFYGPKLEYHIKDSMDRSWQCSTTQIDFFQPERFDLSYIASNGKKERPVIIHRAIYGSFERFLAIILEHYKGNLPLWLAPVQIQILTITDEQKEYAKKIADTLMDHDIRVIIDESADPIAGKIKTAQLEKVPWMLVIGKKETESNTVALRTRDGKQEFGLSLDQLLQKYRQMTQ